MPKTALRRPAKREDEREYIGLDGHLYRRDRYGMGQVTYRSKNRVDDDDDEDHNLVDDAEI